MDRKRPVAKVIPTPLPLTWVQTTEHIRTRSDRVFTVLLSSYGTMVRKQPAAKAIPTSLPHTCVQTTDQIRTRLLACVPCCL
jgi:hypothetical protein